MFANSVLHSFDQTACRWLVQSVRAKQRGYFRLKTLAQDGEC
jgi:hypothetical protein